MTYVVGIKRFDTTAILVDSEVFNYDAAGNLQADPEGGVLKNGVLYPGCIYGFAGDVDRAGECIEAIRRNVANATGLQEKWAAVEQTIRGYKFPIGRQQQFDLMLSTRHTGKPELFVVDSAIEQMQRVEDDICSIGSGKRMMDRLLAPFFDIVLSPERIIAVEERCAAAGGTFNRLDYPYLVAFLIHLSTCGSHGKELYNELVGGIVHFIRQDSRGEERQKPSLYVLAFEDPQTHERTLYRRRISVDNDQEAEVLVVCDKHSGHPAEWDVGFFNNTSTEVTIEDFQGKARALRRKHENEVPYYFLGAGVIDWQRYCQPFLLLVDIHAESLRPWADLTDYLDPIVEGQLNGFMEAPPNEEIARARAELDGRE